MLYSVQHMGGNRDVKGGLLHIVQQFRGYVLISCENVVGNTTKCHLAPNRVENCCM